MAGVEPFFIILEVPMKRLIILSVSTVLLSAMLADHADARAGFGGGGFRGGGFHGAGFGGGYRGGFVGGGARWAGAGIGRPGWGAVGRPGWGAAGRPGWGGAWRPGWNGGGWNGAGWGYRRAWPWYGAAVGLGLAGAAYYGSYSPYGYYDDCPTVQQQYWDGYGYRIAWVNSCSGY